MIYSDVEVGVRHVHLGRRRLPNDAWAWIIFEDYDQTVDDGHNTISLGMSGDGKLHLVWDLHNSQLNYRCSNIDVTSQPNKVKWETSVFGPVLNFLPGVATSATTLSEVGLNLDNCLPRPLTLDFYRYPETMPWP